MKRQALMTEKSRSKHDFQCRHSHIANILRCCTTPRSLDILVDQCVFDYSFCIGNTTECQNLTALQYIAKGRPHMSNESLFQDLKDKLKILGCQAPENIIPTLQSRHITFVFLLQSTYMLFSVLLHREPRHRREKQSPSHIVDLGQIHGLLEPHFVERCSVICDHNSRHGSGR